MHARIQLIKGQVKATGCHSQAVWKQAYEPRVTYRGKHFCFQVKIILLIAYIFKHCEI